MTNAEKFKEVFGVKPSELAIKKLNEFIAYYEQLDLDIESEEDDKTNEADCLDAFRYAVNAIENNAKWIKAIEDIKAEIESEQSGLYEEKRTDLTDGINMAHLTDLDIIDKHTKELL